MSKAHFGLVGLGVMGENLVLNAERNGFSSVVYNRTYAKTEAFLQGRGAGKSISGASNLEEFVSKLERPRRILLMVILGGNSLEYDFDQEAIAPLIVLLTPSPTIGSFTDVEIILIQIIYLNIG